MGLKVYIGGSLQSGADITIYQDLVRSRVSETTLDDMRSMHLSGDNYFFENGSDFVNYWLARNSGTDPKVKPQFVKGENAGFAAGWPSQEVRLQGAALGAKVAVAHLKNNTHVIVDTVLLGTPGLAEEVYTDVEAVNAGKMTIDEAQHRLTEKAKGAVLNAALGALLSKVSGQGFTGRGPTRVSVRGTATRNVQARLNSGGEIRSAGEINSIATKRGVSIPENMEFYVDEEGLAPELQENEWAQYYGTSRLGVPSGTIVKWSEFFSRFGKIRIRINPEILASDEKIVGMAAHEVQELQALEQEFARRGGQMTIDELRGLIHSEANGVLHEGSLNAADEAILRMRQ